MKYLSSFLIPLVILVLSACGGGGGGSSDPEPVTYTGLTTPAVVTAANAKTLAEGVIGGSTTGSVLGVVSEEEANPTILDVARILSNSVTQLGASSSSPHLPGAIVTDSGSDPCLDGGRIEYDLSVDDVTFDFFGTFVFINCTEGGTTLNGEASVTGSLGGSSMILDLTFDSLTVVSGAESYTISGTVNTTATFSGVTIVMNVRQRNNNTQLVEWLDNLTIFETDNVTYLEMTITGRYYHPQHGYVDVVTNTPFQINVADQWPYLGQMTLTGASNSKSRLTALDKTQYSLEVDENGDDIYETLTVENWGA
jgi:hypothetical protein